jgi:hypothetical protein
MSFLWILQSRSLFYNIEYKGRTQEKVATTGKKNEYIYIYIYIYIYACLISLCDISIINYFYGRLTFTSEPNHLEAVSLTSVKFIKLKNE